MAELTPGEVREKIKKTLEREPNITAAALMMKFELSKTTVYGHLKSIREEADIADAVVDEDTIPKEKRMATKKEQGGGQQADTPTVKDLEAQLDWYAQREKELLEAVAVLSSRLVKGLERIEDLEAAAATEAE